MSRPLLVSLIFIAALAAANHARAETCITIKWSSPWRPPVNCKTILPR